MAKKEGLHASNFTKDERISRVTAHIRMSWHDAKLLHDTLGFLRHIGVPEDEIMTAHDIVSKEKKS